MAREDVIIPQLEPAATDYNRENLDRNFNDVSDTLERLRDALTEVANEPSGDLTDLENTVTSLVEDVYDPITGLAQTRARILTEEGVRADADLALAARATTLEATVNDGTTGLVATRARLITEESTRAAADSALASRATTLEATVNDSTTGLVATRARLITEESTRASADSALAARATTLEATVNDGTTGLVATRARLITEESTRATADAALATRATTLEARSFVKGNLVKGARPYYDSTSPNSLFSRFGYVSQGLWSVAYSVYVDGPYFSQGLTSVSGYTWNAMLSNAISIAAGQPISAQAMLGKFGTWTAGTLRLVVYWYTDAAGTTGASQAGNKAWEAGVVIAGQNGNGRWVDLPNLVAPSGTQSFRIGIWTDNVTGNGVYTEGAAWMLKAEYGSTCTAWSDEALPVEIDARVRTEESTRASADSALATRATALETTVNDGTTGLVATRARLITEESTRATADAALATRATTLEATVNDGTTGLVATRAQVIIQEAAIATIEDSAAFYQVLVAASGGDPALIRLFSGLGGSEVAIAAKIISLINTSSGVAMPVMRAAGGLAFFQRPISSDSAGRRVTIGPGYGVSGSEVVLWFGPSSIAPDDQSRTNGTFALGTDGQVYYGGTGLQTGSMQMELNTYVVNLTRLGTGTTSTSMTATGYAPGTLSYSWTLHSGDAVNIGSPSSATTNIGHTLTALGQTKTSVVKCTITSTSGPNTFRLLDISSSEIS